MDQKKLSNFHFWGHLDKAIDEERFSGNRRTSLYPSEAGVVAIDPSTKEAYVIGGCMRKSWYRMMGVEKSNPITTKTKYIFELGKIIENMITGLCKKAGIYNNNSVKFWDKSNYVSGEIDIIVKLPMGDNGEYIFTEVKTTWGGRLYKGYESGVAKAIFPHYEGRGKDRKFVEPKPKDQNLLQILTYLNNFKDDPKLIGGKLVYFLKDNCNRTEFDILVEKQSNGKHRAVVNGRVDERFYVEDMYVRYKQLINAVTISKELEKKGTLIEMIDPPERDYSLMYNETEKETMFNRGELGKTKYEKYKGKAPSIDCGNWQCSYCSFRDVCYKTELEELANAS